MHSLTDWIPELVAICERASDKMLEIYQDPARFDIQQKSDDSPVTAADLAANEVIQQGLQALSPHIPVLSEEDAPDWQERQHWRRFWCVDPLDGTKEFIARTDEFAINIALVEDSKVLLGFIYAPVTGEYWWGSKAIGAFKGADSPITSRPASRELTVIASRRFHSSDFWEEKLKTLGMQMTLTSKGSALKFCNLAEGKSDLYPRMGPTSEWDTAAGQGILEGAGGQLIDILGGPLHYNKQNLLNPGFYAAGCRDLLEC